MFSIINHGSIGIVIQRGKVIRILKPGAHFTLFQPVDIYDCSKPFFSVLPLTILLQNTDFAQEVNSVDIKDNQLAIHFEDGKFKDILNTGLHLFWNSVINHSFEILDVSDIYIPEGLDSSMVKRLEVLGIVRKVSIESFEKALLFKENKFESLLEPGEYYFWKNAVKIDIFRLDLRQQQVEISGQEILTKDKANIRLNFMAYYKVVDPIKIGMEIKDYKDQLYSIMQMALREYIGELTLDDLLANKLQIGEIIVKNVKEKSATIGISIMDAGVKDIILPGDIKDILNQVLIAEKKAQANIITRWEETASTRSLLNTAKLMEENQVLYKLKELEYVERLTEKISHINLSGGGSILEQLKELLVNKGGK